MFLVGVAVDFQRNPPSSAGQMPRLLLQQVVLEILQSGESRIDVFAFASTWTIVQILPAGGAYSGAIWFAQNANWSIEDNFFAQQRGDVQDAIFGQRGLYARFRRVDEQFFDGYFQLDWRIGQTAHTLAPDLRIERTLDENAA